VAVGQAGELVLTGDLDRRREVARRDAVDGRRDRPERADQVGRQKVREEHSDQGRRDDSEEQDSAERLPARRGTAGEQHDDPEGRQGQDGCGNQADRETGAER
jgi:hypothetical protein